MIVETAKWAEDEEALIVRLYEADGGATTATLALGLAPEVVDQVDLPERNPRPCVRPGQSRSNFARVK